MTTPPTRALRVFLAYAREDGNIVSEFDALLRADGFSPWFDRRNLVGGQHWKIEIQRAVKGADAVVVFLSRQSVMGSGYRHKELSLAIEVAEEQPEGSIFLIPFRLDNCDVPSRLGDLHVPAKVEPVSLSGDIMSMVTGVKMAGTVHIAAEHSEVARRSIGASYLQLQRSLVTRAAELELADPAWILEQESKRFKKVIDWADIIAGEYVLRGLNPDGTQYYGRSLICARTDPPSSILARTDVQVTTFIGGHSFRYKGVFDGGRLRLEGDHSVQYLRDGTLACFLDSGTKTASRSSSRRLRSLKAGLSRGSEIGRSGREQDWGRRP